MKKHRNTNIAVIGGGIAGTLSAIELANKGFHVDLYDREADIMLVHLFVMPLVKIRVFITQQHRNWEKSANKVSLFSPSYARISS